MADSWWDELLARMFAPQTGGIGYKGVTADTASKVGKQAAPAFKSVQDELARQEKAANGAPAPTPTAAQQQQQAQTPNPNAREAEQAQRALTSALGNVQAANPLYGNLPNGHAYMGTERKERGKGSEKFVKSDKFASIQEVIASVNDWSEKKRQKFAELAVDAGLLKQATTNYDDLEPILGQLAIRSAKLYERGVKVTPWALLERYGKAGSVPGAGGGPVTTTTVNKSINLTSPREADALVDAALQQRLGRSPTEKEKKEFLSALNSSEKKEPTVTKTTTTTSGAGTENVSSNTSSNTSGGVDVGAFAREWSLSHNKDEAGSYQALAQYMPAFYAALGAPV